MDSLSEETTCNFLKMLAKLGHESPMEHASFTFGIEEVSRSLLAQITRHRIASFSVQSQRYVAEGQFFYLIPPEIENIDSAKNEFISAMEEDQNHYNKITAILKEQHKKSFIKDGKNEEEAEKLAQKSAIEDARFILPNACATKMICTFNARSLMNFFKRRLCNRAQWEIRSLATEMLKLVLKVAPNLFSQIGPPCFSGECREGRMACGKKQEVLDCFSDIHKRYKI
jgi:thymidylate synthase (FAD)